MLHYLLPWMNNVELVDFKPLARRQDEPSSTEEEERDIMMVNSRRWLKGEGWGSPHATTMILNNLMFMTAKVNAHILHADYVLTIGQGFYCRKKTGIMEKIKYI